MLLLLRVCACVRSCVRACVRACVFVCVCVSAMCCCGCCLLVCLFTIPIEVYQAFFHTLFWRICCQRETVSVSDDLPPSAVAVSFKCYNVSLRLVEFSLLADRCELIGPVHVK